MESLEEANKISVLFKLQKPPNSSRTLQFVTESGISRPIGSSRKLIRAQARRKFVNKGEVPVDSTPKKTTRNSEQKFINSDLLASDEAPRLKGSGINVDINGHAASSTDMVPYPSTIQQSSPHLASLSLDPYNSISLGFQGDVQLLLHHCLYRCSSFPFRNSQANEDFTGRQYCSRSHCATHGP